MNECMHCLRVYISDDYCFVIVCSFVLIIVVKLFCVDIIMIPDNDIGVEGAKALVPALKSLSRLTTLNLGSE